MFSEGNRIAMLIADTVQDVNACNLLYQARVNFELFEYAKEKIHEELDALNFHNFARSQTCHMNEGIFGAAKHKAMMIEHKQRVLSFLIALVTAGYRYTRSLQAARTKDRGTDWKCLRRDIDKLEDEFHKVRNFLEHMDEAIARGEVSNGLDCTFTPDAVLTCKDKNLTITFDFSKSALDRYSQTYIKVIKMLEDRKAENAKNV